MNYFSDTQETASRFGDFIDDLHDVFRCNDVDYGSPEDFFAFARTLKYHSELRGDVLRVVKAVMESETDVSFRSILTVIAVASGGPEIATSEREMSIPVKLVIESLIGVGVCSQLTAEHPGLYSDLTVKENGRAVAAESLSPGGDEAIAHTEENAPVPIVALEESSTGDAEAGGGADVPGQAGTDGVVLEATVSDSSDDQSLPGLPTLPGVPNSQGPPSGSNGPPDGHQSALNDLGGSNTLAESLTRLELNSLQLKIYLDSIDQRISRMEPRLEHVAPHAVSTPPVHAREDGAARFSATIPAATIPVEAESHLPQSDPTDSNPQGGAATTGIAARQGRDASGPLAALSSRRPVALPILVGVVMLLLAASLVWRFGRVAGDAVIRRVSASVEGRAKGGDGPGVAPPAASASSSSAGGVREPQVAPASNHAAAASVGATQGNSSTPVQAGQGISRPVDKLSQPSDKLTQSSKTPIPLKSPSPSSAASAEDTEAPEMAADTSEAASPPVRTYNLSSAPSSNRLVNVSSGVMAANLLSGPKPSYPTLASLMRTQGNVVMQVVISKKGTVEHLKVIKGHRLLRGAAKNAVQNWRYRPYKVGGVPVEVATIVSVDFSLHR